MTRSERATFVVLTLTWLAACQGDGSDIGPKLAAIPDASCKVVVLDDQGRGVVGARVSIDGAVALTGRNGRGDFLAEPRGTRLVTVDGAHGAAVAGDRLGRLTFAATITGNDLPYPIHLPAFAAAGTADLALGVQAAATTLTAPNGGRLTVAAGGTIASDDAAATSVALAVGDLQPQHVPGDLPAAVGGALLNGRVFCIDPPGVSFAPAADLDLPDDLGLGGAGTARLLRLEPTTGAWTELASGLGAAGGRVVAPASITAGGAYVLVAEVPATDVTGRVLLRDGSAAPEVMVTVDGARTVTDAGGRFAVRVPGARTDGSARSVAIELFAGGSWLPVRVGTTFAVTAGVPLDLGDLTLDTTLAGNVRVQQVRRGRAAVQRATRISSLLEPVALATLGDANGQAIFEDVPAQWFGFQQGQPIDVRDVFYGQSIGFLDRGRRWLDSYQFFDQRPWFVGSRRTRVIATDAIGGGPVFGAALVGGEVPNANFVALTNESGGFFVDRGVDGRATVSLRSERDGQVLVHAYSIQRPNGDHLELPLQRVPRAPLGAFDRHGLVAGTVTGADPARQHRLRATRRLELQEWWDDVVEGIPLASALPIDVDPATTHAAFQAGTGLPAGHLAAAELTAPAGVVTLQKLGLALDVAPVEGATTARDIALDLVANSVFASAGSLAGLDPAIVPAALDLDLGLLLPSGGAVDVVRGLRGNHAANGNDLAFTLPPLAGALASHRWLALLRGSFASGGATLVLRSLHTLPVTTPRVLPAFPTVTAPAAGATVAATGFTVEFALPAGARHGTIELRSETAGETLLWQVLVPPDLTQFGFVLLPVEAPTPLLAGRSYTLTVSAYFGDDVLVGSEDPYRDLSTFVHSIGAAERGITQVTRRSIPITAN
ncbi:MAG: hypothetical protein JNL08_19800 [Planctomycetes bacterium]|nr:hypothetical protein [Planctomycetota bacterium]